MFLYADANEARDFDTQFGMTQVPAFMIFKEGSLYYKEYAHFDSWEDASKWLELHVYQ